MTNLTMLYCVADRIQDKFSFFDSRWQNIEAETIACQTIGSCRENHKNHGLALSWYSSNLNISSCARWADNPEGLQKLIDDGCIVVEEYDGSLSAPQGTVERNGKPLVLRVTERLLEYAEEIMGM